MARLEERGWVRGPDCPTDRRGQVAQLTDEGFAALAAAAPGHVEQVRRSLIDQLTPEQVEQLREISEKIVASAEPLPRSAGGCTPESGSRAPAAAARGPGRTRRPPRRGRPHKPPTAAPRSQPDPTTAKAPAFSAARRFTSM